MIVPIVDEAAWLACLNDLPTWDPGSAPVVLIAPHPDDETLAAGGLISALRRDDVDITVVAVTDGENAYPGEDDPAALGALRDHEQRQALARLGVPSAKIVRLRLPDGDVAGHEDALVQRLEALVGADTHLIAPWASDFHPDHEACGRAAEIVARRTGAHLTSYFFWTWHRGEPSLLDGLPLRQFVLHAQDRGAKLKALDEHVSQLVRDDGMPILPERLLAPAARPFEVFLVNQ